MVGITGIGSGMDIDAMVSALVTAERAPKESQLATLEKATTTRITSIGSLKSAISTFQTALGELTDATKFQGRTATASKADYFSVKAGTTAGVGSYDIQVKQLAAGSKVALAAVAPVNGEPATFGGGTLTVSIGAGDSFAVAIDSNNNTLAGVRDAINKAGAEKGVSATIINDEQGARLVLTSTKMGDGADISVATQADAAGATGNTALSTLDFSAPAKPTDPTITDPPAPTSPSAARMITRAQDAEISVDGFVVKSASNTVDSAIEGVTLDLKAATPQGEATNVAVSLDTAGVKGSIEKFVEAYNKLIGTINSETKVTPVGEGKTPVTGALVGDATARGLLSTIRNELVNVQGDGAIRALADLGITTQRDGTLKSDTAKLDKAVANNFSEIATLFAGENGLATRLDSKLKPYTETGGILEQRNKSMTETIDKIDKQREDLTRRITALQERLYKQFNAMDTLVGQLTNTSNSLLASLENLPWAAGNKD